MVMHDLARREKLTDLSPVKFDVMDTVTVKLLKALITTMISYHPSDRPRIDRVREEIKAIQG